MPVPIRKRKNSLVLKLSNELYASSSIEKSLRDFKLPKKLNSRDKKYTSIEFKAADLNAALEFNNYLLSLNR